MIDTRNILWAFLVPVMLVLLLLVMVSPVFAQDVGGGTESPTPTVSPPGTETTAPTDSETETTAPTDSETETTTPTDSETETTTPTDSETETTTPTDSETETTTPTDSETETTTPTDSETETTAPTDSETETTAPTDSDTETTDSAAPATASPAPERAQDSDGDWLSDVEEEKHGTIPNNADTDSDGLLDGDEVKKYRTNPTKEDSDSDGLSDREELNEYGTNPLLPDSDEDGLTDGHEVSIGSDPSTPNSFMLSSTEEEPAAGGFMASSREFLEKNLWLAPALVGGMLAVGLGLFVWWFLLGGNRGERGNSERERDRRRQEEVRLRRLQSDLEGLRVQAVQLRELNLRPDAQFSLPDRDRGGTLVDNCIGLVNELRERLRGLELPSGEDRGAINRLAAERAQAGFRSDVLREVAREAPASALQFIRGVVEELEAQRRGSSEMRDAYRRQIEEARQLCNREIADTVASRLPRSILDAAERILDRAETDDEVRARQEAVEAILRAVYERYFPRHTYQPPEARE